MGKNTPFLVGAAVAVLAVSAFVYWEKRKNASVPATGTGAVEPPRGRPPTRTDKAIDTAGRTLGLAEEIVSIWGKGSKPTATGG